PSCCACQRLTASRSGAMPAVGVYFVRFRASASMAAALMWMGVGKSGSPGPKSTTSRPRARNFSASARTTMVGETVMRSTRLANLSFILGPQRRLLDYLGPQAPFNRDRNETAHRAAQLGDLANQPRTQEAIFHRR